MYDTDKITVQISPQELGDVLQAYHTIQMFLEKFLSPNELYQIEFLNGLKEAQEEVASKTLNEVTTFDEFIG